MVGDEAEGVKSRNYLKVKDYWEAIFKPRFKLISSEFKVYGDFGLNAEVQRFGAIDYFARVGEKIFLIEEDMACWNKWHWTKILGYRAAYILDFPMSKDSQVIPCIFLNEKIYSHELRNIVSFLHVEYFFFDISGDFPKPGQSSLPELFL